MIYSKLKFMSEVLDGIGRDRPFLRVSDMICAEQHCSLAIQGDCSTTTGVIRSKAGRKRRSVDVRIGR